jgi:hypothetical protein
MPTPNPRVSVTLTPELSAILQELSVLSGDSKSALIAGLLEQSAPVLQRMVSVLQAAATIKNEAAGEISRGLQEAHATVERQLGLALGAFDEGVRPLLADAEKVKRRRGRAEGGGAAPVQPIRRRSTPMSNRGVTPLPPKGQKQP